MRTKTKIWLIIAASLVLIGCMVFGGVMTVLKWDFSKLSTVKYETNNYEISEEYKDISIKAKTADILFVPSENVQTKVVCYEEENQKHSVNVKDGALVIEVVNTKKWYENIGINFSTPKITVYIPKGDFGALFVRNSTGDVNIPKEFKFQSIDISQSTGNVTNYASALGGIKIKTSTGDIYVEQVSASRLDLSVLTGKITVLGLNCEGDVSTNVSTGKTYLTDIKCNGIISNGTTGDISLKNVIATGEFSIQRSTGDVKFDSCDAAELFIKTDTGNVTGSLLTKKVFITNTDTGNIDVPKTLSGGKCEITTDTGDIKIQIP